MRPYEYVAIFKYCPKSQPVTQKTLSGRLDAWVGWIPKFVTSFKKYIFLCSYFKYHFEISFNIRIRSNSWKGCVWCLAWLLPSTCCQVHRADGSEAMGKRCRERLCASATFSYTVKSTVICSNKTVIYILMTLNFYVNRWSQFIPRYIYLHIPDTVSFWLYIS